MLSHLSKVILHNRVLLLTQHFNFRLLPRALTTMAPQKKYDAIVIGSGQAGTPLAGALAKAGHKTALIEREYIGGCCVNVGCTPTKTMVANGRAAYLARRGKDYGVHSPGGEDGKIAVDMVKVRQRKRDIVTSFRGGNESRTAAAGVEVLMGEASFTGEKTLLVRLSDGSEATVKADLIFINTGERPAVPEIQGIETVDAKRVLDSTSIQELDEIPGHLLVIGGGYVGLEFGQLFRRLGSEVTLIQRGKQLLPREDADIAECMLKILQEDGLTVHLNTSTTGIAQSKTIDLTISSKDGTEQTISGTHLLMAAGRVPNSNMLNLKTVGISTNEKGYIITNEKLETTSPGIYALGDVKGPPAFTHISYDDFRIIRSNLIEKTTSVSTITNRLVPYVVYTDPQLGHIGLHEAEARAAFPDRKIGVASMPMAYVARALETDESRGMMKAVVDKETGEILGFTCLGLEGGELMAVVQMAIMGKVKYKVLQDAVWAHPSLAESLNNLWGFLK
jgi:pyruvate/2-oxoglutarate dehydrogenase complex dihydrolipoamide dehydrogenase (E3) component